MQTKPAKPDVARPVSATQSSGVSCVMVEERRREGRMAGSTARLPASPHSPVQHTRLAAVTP